MKTIITSKLTKTSNELFLQLMESKPIPISELVTKYRRKNGVHYNKYTSGWKLKPVGDLPNDMSKGGIYVYWWLNNSDEERKELLKNIHPFILKGKQYKKDNKTDHHDVQVKIEKDWLDFYKGGNIPLYVGKTVGSIYNRMHQHLKINQKKYEGKTTSDQLRRGIETLFKGCDDTATLIVENVGLSYISMDGYDEAINRFYLENYAIGKLMPLLNVDIER